VALGADRSCFAKGVSAGHGRSVALGTDASVGGLSKLGDSAPRFISKTMQIVEFRCN
jgi:hypothetical protein